VSYATTVEAVTKRIERSLEELSVEGGATLTAEQTADLINLLASLNANRKAKEELAKNMIE
jgi:hypothetical protein